jgi:hypothetical protein
MLFIEKPPLTIDGPSNPETVYLCYIPNITQFIKLIQEVNRVSRNQYLPEIIRHIIEDPTMNTLISQTSIDSVIEMAKQVDTIEISPRLKEMGQLEYHKKNIKLVVVFTETYKQSSSMSWWKQFLPLTTHNAIFMNKSLIMAFLRKLVSTILPNVQNELHIVTTKYDIFKSNNIYRIHEQIALSPQLGYICFPKGIK